MEDKDLILYRSAAIIEFSDSIAKRGLDIIPILKKDIIFVPGDYSTIEEAIKNANSGAKIYIRGGAYQTTSVIDKSISITGLDDKVQLSISDNDNPVFLIQEHVEEVHFENIEFIGTKASYCQPAIITKGNKLRINKCMFKEFELDFNMWEESGSKEYILTSAIDAKGAHQSIVVTNSIFDRCEQSIASSEFCKVVIKNNHFIKSQLTFGNDVRIKSKLNVYVGDAINLGSRTYLISHFDTFIKVDTLIHSSSDSYSEFFHCTILSTMLIGIAIGEELINPDNEKLWMLGKPKLVFENCIVIADWGAKFGIGYTSSARNLNINSHRIPSDIFQENIVDFTGNNLLHIPPRYVCKNPGLNVEKSIVKLDQTSPAISKANDGTNLGSYQTM